MHRRLLQAIVLAPVALLVLLIACGGLDSSLTDLEVGDCVKDPALLFQGEVESLDHVDCSEPGTLRVVRVFDITGFDDYPGQAIIDAEMVSGCPFDTVTTLFPTRESLEGADDREVVCFE